jgi:hypothetical protein
VNLLLGIADIRDIVIIIVGSLSILLVLAMLVFTIAIGLAVRVLVGTLNRLAKDEASPLLHQVRETTTRVRGTATFIGETAVSPIIRTYGVVAGTRRAMGVLTGLAARRNGRTGTKPGKDD